jgi:hypothetical protein
MMDRVISLDSSWRFLPPQDYQQKAHGLSIVVGVFYVVWKPLSLRFHMLRRLAIDSMVRLQMSCDALVVFLLFHGTAANVLGRAGGLSVIPWYGCKCLTTRWRSFCCQEAPPSASTNAQMRMLVDW